LNNPNLTLYPNGKEFNLQELNEWIYKTNYPELNNKYCPFGHGYVIAMTLLEDVESVLIKRELYFEDNENNEYKKIKQ